MAQYAAKERRENARDESESHIGQFDDADPEETRGRFSSQAGILRGAGHGWIPNPDTRLSSQASILRGAGHGWILGPDVERRLGSRPYVGSESRRTPYPTRVYWPFANPSLMGREEYNDCNHQGANNVRIGDEPVAVNAPYPAAVIQVRQMTTKVVLLLLHQAGRDWCSRTR